MNEKILAFLKSKKDFVSGEDISKALGVTRASIWKNIKKLKEQGYTIIASTKKGYKLVEAPNIITKEELKSIMDTEIIGKHIEYYDEVDSTNNQAKLLARQGAPDGTMVIADVQTHGKGRLGREWISPKGTGIWMSIILRPPIMPHQTSCMTLIAGLDMCEAIRSITGLDARIKWPNDIVIGSKKVCGILTEMSAEIQRVNYMIVGIGVNVNTESFDESIGHATSLLIEGGREYVRKEIIHQFAVNFEKSYRIYTETNSFTPFIEAYREKCITLGKDVKIMEGTKEYLAYAKDIQADGSLLVRMEKGEERSVVAGEVSVRGMYGYI